MKATFNVMKNM